MSKLFEFPSINSTPKAMLQNIARDLGDEIVSVILVIQTEEEGPIVYSSTKEAGELCIAAVALNSIADKSLNGNLY